MVDPWSFKYCGMLTVHEPWQHTARITTRDDADDCTILRLWRREKYLGIVTGVYYVVLHGVC